MQTQVVMEMENSRLSLNVTTWEHVLLSPREKIEAPPRVFFRERIIARRFASSSNKMRLFSCDRDQQYCVKAFHKIRGPRRCNCYRVQVNSDFAQNTVGTRVAAIWMCRHVRNGGRREYGGPRGSGDGGTKRRSDLLNTIRLSTVMTRVCKYYFACTRGQSMTRSLCPPFPLCIRRISSSLHSSMIENATWEKVRERSRTNFRMINQPRENDTSIRGL